MRTAKFNRIAVAEIAVNLLENPPLVKAKGAFINTITGATHGYTTGSNWSPSTLAKLAELALLMEADMSRYHFEDGGNGILASTTGGGGELPPPGIGEHLGKPDDGVPQG